MSSTAACKNIYTQIVFYRSHWIPYPIKHLKTRVPEQMSTAAFNVMSTDTFTSLDFCVHRVRFTGGEDGDECGDKWTDGGWHRDSVSERGGKTGFRFEGTQTGADLALKWKVFTLYWGFYCLGPDSLACTTAQKWCRIKSSSCWKYSTWKDPGLEGPITMRQSDSTHQMPLPLLPVGTEC